MTSKQSIRANNVHMVTEAALDLFYNNGIDDTTINDIAAHAGISKMSIFRYFNSKVEIVEAATDMLFEQVDSKFKESGFSDNSDTLTGMQLAKNFLCIYRHFIDHHIRFCNYLCGLALFLSKHDTKYSFPKGNFLKNYWIKALQRGMEDNTIAQIENYETSYNTIHNIFMGLSLRLYIKGKDLSSPVVLEELTNESQRTVEIIEKYLAP